MEQNKRILLLVTGDMCAAVLAILAAMVIQHNTIPTLDDVVGLGAFRIILFVLVVLFLSFLAEIYKNHHDLLTSDIVYKIIYPLGVACLVFSFLSYTNPENLYANSLLVSALISFGILQFVCHLTYRLYVKFKGFARKVLILGVGPIAGHMGALIPASDENYVLSGYVQCANEVSHVSPSIILESSGGLYETVKREQADKIVVSLSERRGVFPFQEVMACKLDGIEVIDAPSFYEQITGKLFLEGMTPSWIIFSEGFKVSSLRKVLKRGVDIACAVIGIMLIAPFLPLIALAIKLDSTGPILYWQERVGEKEKLFKLYKFRTMCVDAES